MTIALDDHRYSTSPLLALSWSLRIALRHLAKAWHDHWQAVLLRSVDPATRADIGYSRDYVRIDWEDFASTYPTPSPPPPVSTAVTLVTSGRHAGSAATKPLAG